MPSLLIEVEIDVANEFGNFLRRAVHEHEFPDTQRVQAAAGCFAIAQDHHHAIVILLNSQLYASAFALVRCGFDAYVRGEWLSTCATDVQVDLFLKCERPPEIGPMITELERTPAFQELVLSAIKKNLLECDVRLNTYRRASCPTLAGA